MESLGAIVVPRLLVLRVFKILAHEFSCNEAYQELNPSAGEKTVFSLLLVVIKILFHCATSVLPCFLSIRL
jgi:hypothetical protein